MTTDAKVTHPVSVAQVIQAHIRAELGKVNTCLPAAVDSYDPATRRAHVTPQILVPLPDGTTQKLPRIPGVPVQFLLSSSRGGLRFDLQPGDTGLVIFSQRSMDAWLAQGGLVDPQDIRRFALSDAVFLPGLVPFTGNDNSAAGALILDYEGASLKLSGGKVAFGVPGAELLDLLDQILAKLIATTVPTAVGTYPLSTVLSGEIAAIKALLATIKGSL